VRKKMLILSGYDVREKIQENSGTIVYRGYAAGRQTPVFIKVSKEKKNHSTEISRLIFEYEIARAFKIEGIIKPIKLEKAGDCFALVMEDNGALPIKEYIRSTPINLETFFDIAFQLAGTMGEFHQNGMVLEDLKLESVFFQPDTGDIKIIDFGKVALVSLNSINEALRGIMPETSEDNVASNLLKLSGEVADYRSDFYSLGRIYYEILTGKPLLTLENSGGNQCIDCMAKQVFPDNISQVMPQDLFSVIVKLLSKDPDLGYQSTYGIMRDLEECRRRWCLADETEPFTPGLMDVLPRFELPAGLFGRKAETEALKAAFDHMSGNESELILVSGYAGTGKTMLVNETLKPIATKKGFFVYGKFDQLKQNIPYSPSKARDGG
jgi:histidine kinase